MKKNRKSAVFILSHGRPDRVKTVRLLEKGNYTGDWYIVCDDEDETLSQYQKKYGDKVLVFSKDKAKNMFDLMDNTNEKKVVVYARNYVFKIAEDLGLTHFIVLDDDYTQIYYVMLFVVGEGELMIRKERRVKNLDKLFEATFDLLDETGALTIAYAQSGDFMGGINGFMRKGFKRKAMNTFFFRTDRKMEFMGRINEDVNAYVYHGMRGELIFSVAFVAVRQIRTQTNEGGLTDAYKNLGTYVKSFYTVMLAPSCVKIGAMGELYPRLHHVIDWEHCVPKIISDRYKKRGDKIGEKIKANSRTY